MNDFRPVERSLMLRSISSLVMTAAAWWILDGVAHGASPSLVGSSSGHAVAWSSVTEQEGEVTVEATARGASASEARKEAIVAALRKVVGEYVEADVAIADDEVVRNELLSFSNAGGVRSEQVGEARLVGDEVEVTMRVTVKPKPLVARVKGAAKAGAKLDGPALAAEIAAAKDDYEAKKRVLEKAFADLPDAFMTIRIVDSEGKEAQGIDRKLVKADKKTGEATITIPVVLGFDAAVWKNNVRPALHELLTAIAERKVEEGLSLVHDSESWSNNVFKYTRTPVKGMKIGGESPARRQLAEENVAVFLEKEDLGRGRQLNFVMYEVAADLLPFFRSERHGQSVLHRFETPARRILRVRLLDASGELVDGVDVVLNGFYLPSDLYAQLLGVERPTPYCRPMRPLIEARGSDFESLYIAPRWMHFDAQQSKDAVIEAMITLPAADLELIEKIEVELIGAASSR